MKTSYFTFGQNHTHTLDGVTLDKDCIVRITNENPREKMFYLFGDKWSFEHDVDDIDARYFNRGIFPISTNNKILDYKFHFHIDEFYNADDFANFIIDRVLDLGLYINEDFIDIFPLYNEDCGRLLFEVISEDSKYNNFPNFEKYQTNRGWCYDAYNSLKKQHDELAESYALQVLCLEGEFELVDSIESILEASK